MPTDAPHVLLEEHGNSAWLRLNRPEQRNTLSGEMMDLLQSHLAGLRRRTDIDVIVLTGNGPTFCPGADLTQMSQTADPDTPPAAPPVEQFELATLLAEMPQVTVAAINGGCAGPGMAWAAACDLRISSSAARFSTALINAGLVSEFGLIWSLRRTLGVARAKELMLLGEKFDAQHALAIGFVSRVFDASQFQELTGSFVQELAARSPAALRGLKAAFFRVEHFGMREFVEDESVRHVQLLRERFE